MRLLTTLALLCLLTAAQAQVTASFTSYGAVCPNTNGALKVTGVPRLGTQFSVSGILFPGLCTRKFCACTCCDCNDCSGSVLFLGVTKILAPLPGGCPLLASPDIMIPGNVTVSVPNDARLIGFKFYMQRLDLALKEVTGTNCPTTYRPLSFIGTSDGVEGNVGL